MTILYKETYYPLVSACLVGAWSETQIGCVYFHVPYLTPGKHTITISLEENNVSMRCCFPVNDTLICKKAHFERYISGKTNILDVVKVLELNLARHMRG